MIVEITEETRDKVLKEFIKRLNQKRVEKGSGSFNSPLEGYAKIAEEFYELMIDMHAKNWKGFKTELLDVMISAYWTYCSMESQ